MRIRHKFGILIAVCIVVATFFWYTQREPYSTEAVVDSLSVKYDTQSTMIGNTDPVIWIDVYNKNDIPKAKEYLQSKLSKKDLEHYKLDVFSSEENH
jgi:hypothetical protein